MRISAPEGIPLLYLRPGELFFSARPSAVHTVLGSCVAVLLYCPDLRSGAICHALLPRPHVRCAFECTSCSMDERDAMIFVDGSVSLMLRRFEEHGAGPSRLVAKVFGGASFTDLRGPASIGAKNARAAFCALERRGIRVTASETGGNIARKVLYLTHTGHAIVRPVQRTADERSALVGNYD
ncbi:MAG: hypothetical protein A2X93_00075 [Deltaproteobacteria bacterium GWC2_56_8]|nr:MAG: hypothetical protein A2X99_06925 [Deltaproteobacteria bacterium GWB2_55_19]OGP37071.1 MAG: hypothetical protein A2X93_00075 [Deltaproteobacteria bacterium GWC2_56_8]HAO92999.1 chemotaxis protein CheD [Deltaproteobacteria bacterium]